MILAFPGTSTAVLCWVSFKWIFSTLVYVSDVWDLLWVSLILLKDRSDPMEVALLHLLVAYRPFHTPTPAHASPRLRTRWPESTDAIDLDKAIRH